MRIFVIFLILWAAFYAKLVFAVERRQPLELRPKIRVLNWWNYLDKRVQSRIREKGIDIETSIYQSNEVALSRLLSRRDFFDVAVVSNINLDLLLKEKIFDSNTLKPIVKRRKYIELIGSSTDCIPYLWGTTIFAYDSRFESKPPKTLSDLEAMKKKDFQIGVLDDPFEVSARIIADSMDSCPNSSTVNFFSNLKNCDKQIVESKSKFSSKDFITSSDDFVKRDRVAIYGWQGSIFTNLADTPWLKFSLPKDHPIIGADYVCILKNRGPRAASIFEVKKMVELMTDRKSTEFNMETSQYFSPFKDHQIGLHPQVKDLYRTLIAQMKITKPIFIKTPNSDEHKEINIWWKKVRYDDK